MTTTLVSNSADLLSSLDALIAGTVAAVTEDPVLGKVFSGAASRDLYLEYLVQTYHYVLETTPLLRAGARALAGAKDPLHVALHERFAEHEREETGHEQWILDDIAGLGADVEAAKKADPSPSVKAYVAMVRAVGASRTPVGLFGVAYLLEGVSEKLGSSSAKNLRERSGIPNIEKALSFLDSHGSADVGHMEEARATLRKISDPRELTAILWCAQSTSFYYRELLGR